MGRAAGRGRNHTRPSTTGDPGPGSPAGKDIGESLRQDPAGAPINSETGNVVNHETPRQVVPVGEPREQNAGWMAHGVPPEADTTEERASAMRGGPDVGRAGWKAPRPVTPAPVPVPVYIVDAAGGSRPLTTMATNRFTIAAAGTAATRISGRDTSRNTMYVQVENAPGSTSTLLAAGATPAVPATGVAAQNTSAYPVSVVIAANGATITAVSVNGVTVGTAAGTYVVPAYGSISIAYTVAIPTWTWTQLGTGPLGIRIDHEEATLDVGMGALLKPGGGWQEVKGCQDELFAVSADSATPVLDIIYVYELAGAS